MNLGPSKHAGADENPLIVKGNRLVQARGELGTVRLGTHQGHLAAQDVPDLWQPVQSGCDDKLVDPSQFRGSIELLRAKAIHGERDTAKADTALSNQRRFAG